MPFSRHDDQKLFYIREKVVNEKKLTPLEEWYLDTIINKLNRCKVSEENTSILHDVAGHVYVILSYRKEHMKL